MLKMQVTRIGFHIQVWELLSLGVPATIADVYFKYRSRSEHVITYQ